MLRPLLIDDRVKAQIQEVVKFASSNHYHPGLSETIPGDDPRHTVHLLSYRAVFSFTARPGTKTLYRHLSLSVPSKDYPNPFAFCTIAELFGFTGWDGKNSVPPAEWNVALSKEEHCIIAAQAILPPHE